MFGVVKVLSIQTPFTVRTTLKGKRSGLHQKDSCIYLERAQVVRSHCRRQGFTILAIGKEIP